MTRPLSWSRASCDQVERHQVSQLASRHNVVAVEAFCIQRALSCSVLLVLEGVVVVVVASLAGEVSSLDTRRTHCCNNTDGTSKNGEIPSK